MLRDFVFTGRFKTSFGYTSCYTQTYDKLHYSIELNNNLKNFIIHLKVNDFLVVKLTFPFKFLTNSHECFQNDELFGIHFF